MGKFDIIHDSHKLEYRNPFGAVKVGSKVELSIDINYEAEVYIELIYFSDRKKEIKMDKKSKTRYKVILDFQDDIGLVNYYFKIISEGKTEYYGNNLNRFGGIGEIYNCEDLNMYQITIYKDMKIPKWYTEGVIYQIFVDRFFNGNEDGSLESVKKDSFIYATWDDKPMYIKDVDGKILRWDFYGGNLKGILKKLEYIQSLGVTTIYMNPIFESSSCHKYDTGDYEKIDGMFGNEEDLKNLCVEASKRNISIVLDGVFSHTGSDSKYFNKYNNYNEIGAYQSQKSKYYSWYNFYDFPDKYECWWGIDNQPNVNELNEDYIKYIVTEKDSVMKKWMKLGIKGWRLDVADELPDEFIKVFKKEMKKQDEDSVLIGEVWEDASNKVSYSRKREYLFGEELDSITNYPVREGILELIKNKISVELFKNKIMSQYENYPIENFFSNMNILGNHDTERLLTKLDNNISKLKLATLIQMTLPGVPLIYYGDEVGVLGGKDPENRSAFPWCSINGRVFKWYKNLLEVRNNEIAIKKGSFRFIDIGEKILSYERVEEKEKIQVLINLDDEDKEVFNGDYNSGYKVLLSTNDNRLDQENFLRKKSGIIIKILINH